MSPAPGSTRMSKSRSPPSIEDEGPLGEPSCPRRTFRGDSACQAKAQCVSVRMSKCDGFNGGCGVAGDNTGSCNRDPARNSWNISRTGGTTNYADSDCNLFLVASKGPKLTQPDTIARHVSRWNAGPSTGMHATPRRGACFCSQIASMFKILLVSN